MGWKNVKQHYRIDHIVHVNDEGICIGSGYIPDIIVVSPQGTLLKRYDSGGNDALHRYQNEMEADLPALKRLLEAPDVFDRSVPVYTYEGGVVIEKMCEEPGWPNVTHDGQKMYENMFSTDKAEVAAWAARNARATMSHALRRMADLEKSMADLRNMYAQSEVGLKKLQHDFPEVAIADFNASDEDH